MPQMSPLNWLILLIFFSSIYIFINMLNFYFLNYNYKNKKITTNKIQNNWKW